MYKNILFDMGNVIMDFSPDYILSNYTSDVKLINRLKDKIFFNPVWGKSDAGEATEDDVYAEVVKTLEEEYHDIIRRVVYGWYEHKTENEEIYSLMVRLKEKGYRLFLCSNAAESFYKYESGIKAFGLLDAKIVSADIKRVKPNADFFSYVLETYSLNPSECFFIDDLIANVKGAYDCGIDGYWYNGNAKLLSEFMERVGIL